MWKKLIAYIKKNNMFLKLKYTLGINIHKISRRAKSQFNTNSYKFVLFILLICAGLMLSWSIVVSSPYTIALIGVVGALLAAYSGARNSQVVHDQEILSSEIEKIDAVNELINGLFRRRELVLDTHSSITEAIKGNEKIPMRSLKALLLPITFTDIDIPPIQLYKYGFLKDLISDNYEPIFHPVYRDGDGDINIDLMHVCVEFDYFYTRFKTAILERNNIYSNIKVDGSGLYLENSDLAAQNENSSFVLAVEMMISSAPEINRNLSNVTVELIKASKESFSNRAMSQINVYDPIWTVYSTYELENFSDLSPSFDDLQSDIIDKLADEKIYIPSRSDIN